MAEAAASTAPDNTQPGGQGGFGAGGGGAFTGGGSTGGYGGIGGSGLGATGGGGAALGGAIFLGTGGTLTLEHSGFGGVFHATAGTTAGVGGATAGQAHGDLAFLMEGTTLDMNVGGLTTIPDTIAGPGGLLKRGNGELRFTGDNTYTGPTVINAGTLSLAGGVTRLSSVTAVTVAAGATLDVGDTSQPQRAGSIAGAGRIAGFFDGATWLGLLAFGANNTDTSFSGELLVQNLAKAGAGTTTLSGTHAADVLQITGGGVRIGPGGWTGVNGPLSTAMLSGTSTLDLAGQPLVVKTVVSAPASIVNLGAGGTLTMTNAASQIAGAIAGQGTVIKQGAATLVLAGQNTFTGLLDLQGGIAGLAGSGGRLGDLVTLNVAAGATFDFNSQTDTIGALQGAGAVALGTGALTVGNNGASTVFSGSIAGSGSGSLVKIGAGVLALTGVSSHTGGTIVGAGTLLLNGTHTAGPITVAGGVLGGIGTGGAIMAAAAGAGAGVGTGAIAPGDGGPGILHAASVQIIRARRSRSTSMERSPALATIVST